MLSLYIDSTHACSHHKNEQITLLTQQQREYVDSNIGNKSTSIINDLIMKKSIEAPTEKFKKAVTNQIQYKERLARKSNRTNWNLALAKEWLDRITLSVEDICHMLSEHNDW